MQIGLISDTHGFFEPKLKEFFKNCDEIWHAGDIGNEACLDEIEAFKKTRAVYGNIDDFALRLRAPQFQEFICEGLKIFITHIGGYPGRYERSIYPYLEKAKPNIFISGHSHILKVIPDKKLDLLHLNPGAIGKSGFHKVRTAMRFQIIEGEIKDLEILEIPRN